MTDEKTRAALEEMRAFEKAHRLQGEGGNRSETEMADRLKRWADALSALTASGGDVRERLIESIAGGTISTPGGYGELARDDAENIVDTILSDPVLSRTAAPEEPDDEPCKAETHSWSHYRPEQIDSYWIRCTRLGEHDEHEDSHTGLRWRAALPVGGETDGE